MSFSTAAGANYWEAKTASPWIQTGRPFTLMCWVNLTAAPNSWQTICSSYDGTANGWELAGHGGVGTNQWGFTWSTAATYYGLGQAGAAAAPQLATNAWNHLCVRYGLDGSTAQVYDQIQDGVTVGTSTAQGAAIGASSRKFRIHQSSDNAGVGVAARTACFRMFDGVLSLTEVNRNRLFTRCPPELRARCVLDLPAVNAGSGFVPYDLGPKNLGALGGVGTVSTAFDPPAFVTAPLRSWRRTLSVPAAGGSVFNPYYYRFLAGAA